MDEDECLQRITELVYDDNEIVTATFLSKILKINIHNAQSLLDKYVKNADVPDQTDLSWTFTIIGADIDAGLSISIVKQDELETVKSKLQTVLAEHVFSVQRKGDIDLVILSNIEPFTEDKVRTEPLQGSIVSKNSVKRKLRKNSVVNINEVKQDVNKVENKQNASVDVSKPKKNGIEGFLSKGSTASSMQSKPVFTPKVKQNNMMANFFTKSNSFNKTQIINEKTENEKYVKENACSHETIKETRIDVDDEPVSKTTEIHFDENEKSSQDKEDIKQVKRSKKRKSQHKGSQIAKKRKRILETADSDSDIFASSESEEVFSDAHYSDDNFEEEIKPQAVVPMKARQMKQVTEEFLDDEGFLNTVQKCIFVSGDEDEENREENNINTKFDKPIVETKNPSTCEIKKEISLRKPSKNKDKSTKTVQNQQSIMNFFKKT